LWWRGEEWWKTWNDSGKGNLGALEQGGEHGWEAGHEVRSLKDGRGKAHLWGWRWRLWLLLYIKNCMFILFLKVMVNIIFIIIYTKILGTML
jgi:hypothetical protein